MVVKGKSDAPLVELRPLERFEPRGDEEAVQAFHRVYRIAEQMHQKVTLREGELLLVNNKREGCLTRACAGI